MSERAGDEQARKIDAGIDRQLERSPQTSVDLHEHVLACSLIPLTLDHRGTLPIQGLEHATSRRSEVAIERNAFAVHAHAALRRLLPQAAVSKLCDYSTIPTQHEEPFTGASDAPLQQHWKCDVRECADRGAALVA